VLLQPDLRFRRFWIAPLNGVVAFWFRPYIFCALLTRRTGNEHRPWVRVLGYLLIRSYCHVLARPGLYYQGNHATF
jgi:hypothetical protein